MSAARPSPRLVVLMPHSTYPPSAAAAIDRSIAGVFPSSAPTCMGCDGSVRAMSADASAAASARCSRHVHDRSPCSIATPSSSIRARRSCCTVSNIGGPVAQQRDPRVGHVAEHRLDAHPDADVVGFDVDEFGADLRADVPLDDRKQLRQLLRPRRPCRPARDGVGVQRACAVDLTPLQVVGQCARRERARVEDVAAPSTASTGSESGAAATHPRTAATPASARAVARSVESPPRISATCSLMMPPLPRHERRIAVGHLSIAPSGPSPGGRRRRRGACRPPFRPARMTAARPRC